MTASLDLAQLVVLRQDGKKQAKEAEALLKKALVLEPESPDLIHNLAMAFRPQGREDESTVANYH